MLKNITDSVIATLRESGYPVGDSYDNTGAADGTGAVVVGVENITPLHYPKKDYQIRLEIKAQTLIEEDRDRAKIRAIMTAITGELRTITGASLAAASGEKVDAFIPSEGMIFSDADTHHFSASANVYAQDFDI